MSCTASYQKRLLWSDLQKTYEINPGEKVGQKELPKKNSLATIPETYWRKNGYQLPSSADVCFHETRTTAGKSIFPNEARQLPSHAQEALDFKYFTGATHN